MRAVNYLPYIKSFFIKQYPVELTYFVTSSCNFRCKHCFNWQNIGEKKKNELSLDEIKKITKKMPNLLRLLFSGGEPFLRKDLPEICQAFHDNTHALHISIPTNASLPRLIEEKTVRILKKCPNSFVNISLSLTQIGNKRDKFVKFKDSFNRFEETYKRLIKLKKRFNNLGVTVITTLNAENQKEIRKIYNYATSELKVDNFGFNVVRGSPKLPHIKEVDLNYFNFLTKQIKKDSNCELASVMKFPFSGIFLAKKDLQYEIYYKMRKLNEYLIPCYSGRIRGVITETGEVYPCENYMLEKPDLNFGSLREYNYDFVKLWTSAKAQRINKMIKNSKCFCTHECDLETNILFNIRLFPRIFLMYLLNKRKRRICLAL